MHLDKTASHVFRMFSTDEKSGYKATDALCKRFRPVDIEELPGLKFHHAVQENESVEQLGLKLQRLGRKAFPSTDGKDFKQYDAASVMVHGEKSEKPTQLKQTRFVKPPHSKEQPGSSSNAKQKDDSEPQAE